MARVASALAAPLVRSTPQRAATLACTCSHLRPRRRLASSAPLPTLRPRRRFASSDTALADRPEAREVAAGPSTPLPPATRVPASPQLTKLLQAGERSVPIPLDPKSVVPGTMEPVEGAVADADGRVLHRPIPPELPYPKQQTRRRYIIFIGATIASWCVFLHYSSNRLRYNTSVVQTLIWNVKTSPKVRDALGTDVHIVPGVFGPRVDGNVNMMQGVVDVSFRISGILGQGVVFFTSIRRAAQAPFQIIRWKVILDDGQQLDLTTELPE